MSLWVNHVTMCESSLRVNRMMIFQCNHYNQSMLGKDHPNKFRFCQQDMSEILSEKKVLQNKQNENLYKLLFVKSLFRQRMPHIKSC